VSNNCESCQFWRKYPLSFGLDYSIGECRRHPPVIVENGSHPFELRDPRVVRNRTAFPVTADDEHCGEYSQSEHDDEVEEGQ
jgi:hypothetical protein